MSRLIAKLRAHKIVARLTNTLRFKVAKTTEGIIARILMLIKSDLKFY
jgi:hypothetical protein